MGGKVFDTIPARQEQVNESPGPSIQVPPFIHRDSSVMLHTASSISQNEPDDKMELFRKYRIGIWNFHAAGNNRPPPSKSLFPHHQIGRVG
jgi:hypothetical protein